jgi:hypothetical protein
MLFESCKDAKDSEKVQLKTSLQLTLVQRQEEARKK